MIATPKLTPEQLRQIQEELTRTLARIERSVKISGTSSRPGDLDQTTVGRLSRIESLQNQSLIKNLKERERIQLEQVMSALERLEEGSYGVCTGCQVPIQYERLLVFPETRTCTPCG